MHPRQRIASIICLYLDTLSSEDEYIRVPYPYFNWIDIADYAKNVESGNHVVVCARTIYKNEEETIPYQACLHLEVNAVIISTVQYSAIRSAKIHELGEKVYNHLNGLIKHTRIEQFYDCIIVLQSDSYNEEKEDLKKENRWINSIEMQYKLYFTSVSKEETQKRVKEYNEKVRSERILRNEN